MNHLQTKIAEIVEYSDFLEFDHTVVPWAMDRQALQKDFKKP